MMASEAVVVPRPPRLVELGRIPYERAWELQKEAQRALIDGAGEEVIFFCEHEPVITIGKSGAEGNVLVSKEVLAQRKVSLFNIERGGDVTYHGPGQLVVYPILDLTTRRTDVGWYMRCLEDVIIKSLESWNIQSGRIVGKTGVWTNLPKDGTNSEPRKIASIGVRMSRWKTLHGFSLNVRNCREGFNLINPCGMPGVQVTSIEEEQTATPPPAMAEVIRVVTDSLLRVF